MSTVDPFDEIVRSTETRVQQMKPGWEELERMSRKHPKKMAELLYEDGLYWWRVYRRRHRKLEKTFRKLSRRVRAESRLPLAGFKRLLAEITSLLNSGEVVKAEKVLEEVRLRNSRIAPLFAAQDEAEEALDKAEKDLRWEEFPLRAGFMAAQEAARNDKDLYSAFCRGYVTARRDREPDFLLAWMPSRFLEPVEKRTTLAQLIGHASARINLTYHRKLREKWKKGSVDPRVRLHSELPGTVANAWAAWEEQPRDDRRRFLGYVDEALGDLLSEADRLLKRLREADEGEGGRRSSG